MGGGGRDLKEKSWLSFVLLKNEKSLRMPIRKGFSIAEAMITLLIVSVMMVASAPLISRQIKNNAANDIQTLKLIKRIEELESKVGTVPAGAVMFFDSATCPEEDGWVPVDTSWNGRFPRFSGSYDVCDKTGENSTTGACSGAVLSSVTEGENAVGKLYGDTIRNIEGTFVVPVANATSGAISASYYNGGWGYVRGNQMWGNYSFNASNVVPTSPVNRPRTVVLRGCRKT